MTDDTVLPDNLITRKTDHSCEVFALLLKLSGETENFSKEREFEMPTVNN